VRIGPDSKVLLPAGVLRIRVADPLAPASAAGSRLHMLYGHRLTQACAANRLRGTHSTYVLCVLLDWVSYNPLLGSIACHYKTWRISTKCNPTSNAG